MDDYIMLYHKFGFTQQEIILCLAVNHSIFISERTLRRRLRQLNLFRRKRFSDFDTVLHFIRQQVQIHGQLHGYRWMHMKCIQNGLVVTQEIVRLFLHVLDPVGVYTRSRRRLRRRQYYSKGPNYLWHIDCYDKLKPYGISITGCIDGFSRYIIWLGAERNTSNPKIIANYFYHTTKTLRGCPHTVRADMGTENVLVEQMQMLFRANDEERGTLPSFLYGTSPNNQRIEAWWSILRKHHAQYWMNLFQGIKDLGLFSGSFLDKSLIQFCFLRIIQDELNEVVHEWNAHRITSSRNSISPKGRPFIMYHFPETYGATDYLCPIAEEDFHICEELTMSSGLPCDEDVYELAELIMQEEHLIMPTDPHSAINLYITLRTQFAIYFN